MYAADHEGYQRAYGGPIGGDIATNLMPPLVPGHVEVRRLRLQAEQERQRRQGQGSAGRVRSAERLRTNISYRADRPKEKAVAESLQQSLAKVGIKLTTKPLPDG